MRAVVCHLLDTVDDLKRLSTSCTFSRCVLRGSGCECLSFRRDPNLCTRARAMPTADGHTSRLRTPGRNSIPGAVEEEGIMTFLGYLFI